MTPVLLLATCLCASASTAVASADVVAVRTTLEAFNAVAQFPLPVLSTDDLVELAAGDVVSKVRRREDGRYVVMGLARTGMPKEQVWVAALDPHFVVADGVEQTLQQAPHETVLYQWADIPAPFSDRHWVVRVWDNVALAHASNNTMWEHPWELQPGAVHTVRAQVAQGMWAQLSDAMFEGTVETPVNEGAKDFLDLGDGDSIYAFSVVTDTGGGIPDRLVAAFLQAKMAIDVEAVRTRARVEVPAHYGAGHAPMLGVNGEVVGRFE